MRSFVLGCAIVLEGSACSRPPPAPETRSLSVPDSVASSGSTASAASSDSPSSDSPSSGSPSSDSPAPVAFVASPDLLAAVASDVATKGAQLQFGSANEEGDAVAAATALRPLAGKMVLHVGDSMVGGNQGLSKALEAKFTAEGAKFVRDYKVSESIISYDHSPKLKSLVDKYRPDIVVVTLGTNDVFVPYPASMAGNVQNIVKRIGARECYWMGPPTWKADTGIVQVLKEHVTPCKFYDGSQLKLARGGDGIHPTDRGGAEWAAAFWTFFRMSGAAAAAPDAGALP